MSVTWRVLTAPRLAAFLILAALFLPIPTTTFGSHVIGMTTTWGAFFFVVAAVGLVLSRPRQRMLIIVSLIAVASSSFALLLKASTALTYELGFRSCYQIQSPLHPDGFRDGSCEATYDWILPEDGSRFDGSIQFGSLNPADNQMSSLKTSNWSLSAINHLVYNYYDWDPRLPKRERLPLTVYWAGATSNLDPLVVTYIGEGVIRSGDQTIPFVPTYAEANSVLLDERDSSDIFIEYKWSPPEGTVDAPYAAIELTDAEGNPVRPAIDGFAEALLLLAAFFSLLSALLVCYVAIRTFLHEQTSVDYPRQRLVQIFLLSSLWLVSLLTVGDSPWGPPVVCALLLTLFLVIGLNQTRIQSRLVAAATISLTATVGVFATGVPWRFVPVLRGGDDFLTYESFAREILLSGNLRAGEDVFYFAPGIRYSLALLHTILGDGNSWIWVTSIVALLATAWLAITRLVVPSLAARSRSSGLASRLIALVSLLAMAGMGVLIGSDAVWRSGVILFSEFPTWPLLGIALILAVTSRGKVVNLVAVGLLLGGALAHRSNQIIGIAAIAIVAIMTSRSTSQTRSGLRQFVTHSAAVLVPLAGVAGLVPLHNWIFGQRLVFTHDPQVISITTVVQPSALLSDPKAWLDMLSQIRSLLLFAPGDFPIPYDIALNFGDYGSALSPIGWAARFMQIGLVLVLFLVVTKPPGTRWRDLNLFLVPLGFFLPHVFLNLSTYYPRHAVAGYLTLSIALMAISARWLDRISRSSPPPEARHALGLGGMASR